MIAFVFPGQGSQSVGMGTELLRISQAAARVLEEASDACGFDMCRLDEKSLAKTRYAQLAIVAHSLAAYEALMELQPELVNKPGAKHAFAGFSLGEYSALCASGRLTLADTMRLVSRRSELMQEAANANPGSMSAVLGLPDEAVVSVLSEPNYAGRVFAVNYNAPGQLVIAGESDAVAACADTLKAAGARRIIPLDVNGAFHTRLMSSAAEPLKQFAQTLNFRKTHHMIFSNSTGQQLPESIDIPTYLADHLCSPVLWTREVESLKFAGFTHFYECGPGRVLGGLIRKIDPSLQVCAIQDEKTG